MTPIHDMIEQMAADGVPMKTILLAVRTAEIAAANSGGIPVDKAAEKRRAYDRERKAAKKHSTGNSTGIPPDHESALSVLPSSQNLEINQETKKERARGQKLPPEWRPKPSHVDEAAALGWNKPWMFEQAEDMRLWARTNEHRAVARKSNWDLAFSGWMRRNAKDAHARASPKKRDGFLDLAMNLERQANERDHDHLEEPAFDDPGFGSSRG